MPHTHLPARDGAIEVLRDHQDLVFGENKVVKLILDFMRLSDALYSPN